MNAESFLKQRLVCVAVIETVAEAQRRAKKRLPKSVYGALVAGSERGLTVDDNTAAFSELGFAPHVADLSAKRDPAFLTLRATVEDLVRAYHHAT